MSEQTFFQKVRSGAGMLVPRSSFQIGIVLIFVTLVAGWGLFNKDRILTTISGGTELTIEFDRQYRLNSFQTDVKIKGVPIGTVTDVEFDEGRSIVTVKVNDGDVDKLGLLPEAEIRPATLLGGTVYVDLIPDETSLGERPSGDRIDLYYTAEQSESVDRCVNDVREAQEAGVAPEPCRRTRIPVELDRVLDVLDTDAQDGLQASIVDSNQILANGGTEAFDGLLETAPGALPPTGDILSALNGQQSTDLERAIDDLADVVRAVEGDGTQVDDLLDGAAPVAAVLGQEAGQQDVGVGHVELPDAAALPRRRDAETPARLGIEERGEHRLRVEMRQAEVVDRGVGAHERDGVHVPDQPVVFDGNVAHRGPFRIRR